MTNDILAQYPKGQVVEDIHILAYLYHWRAEDIWEMPSQERRVFVDRVLKQNKEENDAIKGSGKGRTSAKSYREGGNL